MNFANKKFFSLDTRCFKAFMAVAEFGTYSNAAEKATMSNTAISEHILRLKEQVGSELFAKKGSAYELTEAGLQLQRFIKQLEDLSSEFHQQVHQQSNEVSGMVRYALPPSCLFSPHFPMLLERRSRYPGLELKVELIPSDLVLEQVESRVFDFGFVTDEVAHPALEYQVFCEEEYILVASRPEQIASLDEQALVDANWINYPGMGHYFNLWRNHFFPDASRVSDLSLHHAGDINSIDGAIKMVAGGLGISVFPRHCVQAELDNESLFEAGNQGKPALMNPIHIVKRKTPALPKRVEVVIQWFFDMHPEYQEVRSAQKRQD